MNVHPSTPERTLFPGVPCSPGTQEMIAPCLNDVLRLSNPEALKGRSGR